MKRLSVDEKNICVNLEMDVTGVVEYSSRYYWGTNPRNDRYQVLFQVGGLFFEYSRWGSYSGTGTSLYEINEEAYRKAIVQNEQKVPGGTFDDGKTLYSLVKTAKKHLNETVGYAFCHVKSPSPVKAAIQKALCAEKARIKAENIKIDRANQKYARKCGSLARKLGLAFENVLAIGADEAKLKNFILSLAEARERLKEMDAQSAAEIKHELLSCGRARKKAAIDKLGIYIADADPNRLSFDELFV